MVAEQENIQGWLEKRDAERLASRIQVAFRVISQKEAEGFLAHEDYSGLNAPKPEAEASEAGEGGEAPAHEVHKSAVAENISISGLKLSDTVESLALLYLATIQAIAHGTRHIVATLNAHGYAIDTVIACGGDTRNPIFVREHGLIRPLIRDGFRTSYRDLARQEAVGE